MIKFDKGEPVVRHDAEQEISKAVIEKYGANHEITVAIEKLSELQKELCKYYIETENLQNIAEQMADVEICLGNLKNIFKNHSLVEDCKWEKLYRLEQRMKKGEKDYKKSLATLFKVFKEAMDSNDIKNAQIFAVQIYEMIMYIREETEVSDEHVVD